MKRTNLKKITRKLFSAFLGGIIAFTSIGIANAKTDNGDPIKYIRNLYSTTITLTKPSAEATDEFNPPSKKFLIRKGRILTLGNKEGRAFIAAIRRENPDDADAFAGVIFSDDGTEISIEYFEDPDDEDSDTFIKATLKIEDFLIRVDYPEKTTIQNEPVNSPAQLTEEEKDKVKKAIINANPALSLTKENITVDNMGNATVTKDGAESMTFESNETVQEVVHAPMKKTPVKNPEQLTEEEKEAVKEAVKNANPNFDRRNITIEVSDNGTVTVTEIVTIPAPDGSTESDPRNPLKTETVDLASLNPDQVVEVASAVCTQEPAVGDPENTLVGISTINRENGNWDLNGLGAYIALESNTKGFIITRNANPKANITPAKEGMIVWDTTENCLKLYSNKSGSLEWNCIKQGCNK